MPLPARSVAASLLLLALAGCGQDPPNITPKPEAPHGGAYFPLPDGQGYVEILKQAVPGQKGKSKIIAYFLDSDRKTLAQAPTGVSVTLLAISPKPLPFAPTRDADPAKAGELATDALPDRDGLAGDLSATIDGKPVTVPINAR